MKVRIVNLAAVAALALLTGCNATMGDLQRHAENLSTSVQAAVTPHEVMTYKAYADAARPVLDAADKAMKQAGVSPRVEVGNVIFRDSIGRRFDSPLIVKSFRFAIPQDAIDAESKELQPLVDAIGAKVAAWSATEPYELVAISSDDDGADYLVAQLRKSAPTLKVTKQVGSVAAAGYSGIEMRMVNTNLNRQLAAAATASAAK